MKNRGRLAVFGMMCSALAMWGIGAAGGASAAAPQAPAAQQVVVHQVAQPQLVARAAALHCRNHSAESKPVKGKVVVPSTYCYDPDTNNHRGWHDYCTSSPDSVHIDSGVIVGSGTVDFRGPCARHDMCLQSSHSHSKCDGPLLSDLKKNCTQKFSKANPARYKCYAVAYTYYGVIKLKTKIS